MGYCYSFSGALVCDKCGKAEGKTRKRKCPSAYCPSPALCPECSKEITKSGAWKKAHAHCAARSAEFRTPEERRRALMAAGVPVRCSALGYFDDTGRVRVLFATGADHRTAAFTGYDMDQETYRALPLGEVFTPDDYRALGPILEAPGTFDDVRAIHAIYDAARKTMPAPAAV